MADTGLPPVGVQAVVEDRDPFIESLKMMQDAVQKTTDSMQKQTDKTTGFGKILDKVGLSVDGITGKINEWTGVNAEAITSVAEVATEVTGLGLAIIPVIGVIVAIVGAIVALGQRGQDFIPIIQGFDRLAVSVGTTSSIMLTRMREASSGLISDMNLIRYANQALIGTTGDFQTAFADKIPQIMRIARAQAALTGRSFEDVYTAIETSIKRATPRMLNQTGIIVNSTVAFQRYAASIGETVSQLNLEQRQTAILNAVLAAGENTLASYAGVQESAKEKTDRMSASIDNMLNSLSLNAQPAFGMLLDAVQNVLNTIAPLVVAIGATLEPIFTGLASVISTVVNVLTALLSPFIDLGTQILPYVGAALQTISTILQGLGGIISGVLGRVGQIAQQIFQQVTGVPWDQAVPSFFRGGARMIGALAGGIMNAANLYVFPAVISIAKFIADFLSGMSPPPKGPLSTIDRGGANTMKAWLGGFVGVGLDAVSGVASGVAARMAGVTASVSAALAPYLGRLQSATGILAELKAQAESAMASMNKEIAALTPAMEAGDQAAAERIQQLDMQEQLMQDQIDAQQKIVDFDKQEFEAKARSLGLTDRQIKALERQRQQAEDAGKAAGEGGGKSKKPAKPPKLPKGATGAAVPSDEPTGGGSGIPSGGIPSVQGDLSGQQAVQDAMNNMQQGFQEGIGPGIQDTFNQNVSALGDQLNRIGSADIGSVLQGKLSGIGDSISKALDDASKTITDWLNSVTDPSVQGSIPYEFSQLGGKISTAASNWSSDLQGRLDDLKANFNDWTDSITNPTREGSVPYGIARLGGRLSDALTNTWTEFGGRFDTLKANLTDWVDSVTNQQREGSVPYWFSQLGPNISAAVATLGDDLQTNVITPISDKITTMKDAINIFFTGDGDGTIHGMINTAVAFFADFPTRVTNALGNMGRAIWNAVANPMIAVINGVITTIKSFIQTAMNGLADLITNLKSFIDSLNLGIDTSGIANFASQIRGAGASFNIPTISVTMPANIAGAATGGMFGKGLMKVGERGTEFLMNSAERTGVFPNEFVRSVNNLTNVLAQPNPVALGGSGGGTYNTSNNNSRTVNATINGVDRGNDLVGWLNMLMTYR